ncbi:MAG: alanine racemase [Gordonia sp. (in: high G+C Gram-positive bacteria)]
MNRVLTESAAASTATVDLSAIAHNLGVVAERSGAGVIGVVKADAYGHGAVPVARALVDAGVAELGVAHITEARVLRAAGVEAHLTAWLHTPGADFGGAIDDGVDVAVSSPRQLHALADAARERGTTAEFTLKIDTGLARSGIAPGEWAETARDVARLQAEGVLRLRATMCHLVCGDEPDNPLNSQQAAALDAAVDDLRRLSVAPDVVHIANSPAALTRPDLARDLVRPGIALYGYSPIPQLGDFGLIPAMTLSATVALVKKIDAGQGVSYGHTWVAPRDTVVAVLPIGYADGVPRLLSNRLTVDINGRSFPGVGRICMDQLVVELGPDGGGVAEGDVATLFGPTPAGAQHVPTATDWADEIGTIDYEIVTGIRGRVVRRYVGEAVK